MTLEKSITEERRQYKRYPVRDGAYTANATKPGRIIDIGLGGLACQYIDRKLWPNQTHSMDLIYGEDNAVRIINIPYRVVSEHPVKDEHRFDSTIIKRQSIQFGELTRQQISELEEFIKKSAL
ncbi:MAG: PilZ domain-containing protein [Proteobacteria bacterium]|nr:PilZ domain-containing protein [Pseudomonadota bacterium]MBU1686538.1 PilZ domain-containing protein [Pseudomonadota bacterium]